MNLAETILRKHEDAVFRIALQDVKSEGINTYSFGGLDYLSDKFATMLSESGIGQGDVVAVMLPQSAAFAISHLAILKLAAIVLPISLKSELSLIQRILEESHAKSLIIVEAIQPGFLSLNRDSLDLASIFVVGDLASQKDFGEGFRSFWYEVNFADSDFAIVEVETTTPAYIFFDEKADGNIKSSSITHGESIEAFKNSHSDSPEPKVFWTTQDWASVKVVIEIFFKIWINGDAIASYDSGIFVEKDVEDFFKHLGYAPFPFS